MKEFIKEYGIFPFTLCIAIFVIAMLGLAEPMISTLAVGIASFRAGFIAHRRQFESK